MGKKKKKKGGKGRIKFTQKYSGFFFFFFKGNDNETGILVCLYNLFLSLLLFL